MLRRILACSALLAAVWSLQGQALAVGSDDPDFAVQWYLHNTGQIIEDETGIAGADIDILGAWSIHQGTSSSVVAIIGRGINPHPEFADRLLEGIATVGDLFDTLEICNQDTHLAGLIAAAVHDGSGITGVHGSTFLLPVRVFDSCIGEPASVATGIIWAVNHGADVVLVPIQFDDPDDQLAGAIDYAESNDVVVVAPVGSAGTGEVSFPAAYPTCLAVSATTNRDEITTASNFGPQVDLAAPGRNIWSTWSDGGYAFQQLDRDSVSASALVAAVASLLRSYAPHLAASELRAILTASAEDLGPAGWDERFGAGRLNAHQALALAPPPALRFERTDTLPVDLVPGSVNFFTITIAAVAEQVAPGSAFVRHRTGGGVFLATALVDEGAGGFRVPLPALPCGTTLEFYLEATGTGGTSIVFPRRAPQSTFSATAKVCTVLFFDDFETDLGWIVDGGDNSSGRWDNVEPVATAAQPGFDATPDFGRRCFITGQHFGSNDGSEDGTNDVDGGPMQLTSPTISITNSNVQISYARWFASFSGIPDQMIVEVSRDDGASWQVAEVVQTPTSEARWVTSSFLLNDVSSQIGDQLRVRFSVSDAPNDSLTEAGVDEFRVTQIACTLLRGDTTGDGVIDLADMREMSSCFQGPSVDLPGTACTIVDFDGNGKVDLFDWHFFQRVFDSP